MNTDPGELWLGLELAAMQGDAASQAALGVMHYLGHDSASCRPIPQNLAEARRLLELAAAQGNSHAQAALDGLDWDAEDLVEAAPYEENGEGGPVDFTEARRLYEFAAAQGDTGARAALDTVNRVAEVQRAKEQACWNFAEATRLFKLAAAKGHAHLSGQCASEDMTEARRLYRLAASQGSAGAQEALDGLEVLDRAAEVHRAKKQAEADAMMEQLLAEDAEEKKAKGAAKSAKSAKKARKKRREPAAATSVGTDYPREAGDAGEEAGVEDSGDDQAVLVPVTPSPAAELGTSARPAASEPASPLTGAEMAAAPVPVAIGGASGWGRGGRGLGGRGLGGRGLGGRGGQRVQSARDIGTGGDMVSVVALTRLHGLPGQPLCNLARC